ncbi:hypothetical protein CPLU01_15303 [Colletotrichum plurivorum]|uniref:Uncharacterized protein n=1 Tax=Colletotrichum plurivorum TaxID=2175906 RepID=A0A8H6MW81_9PEZI|nr:hypothetical protein CPLU01_15303 [Colletotrichum plurivorum]
MHDIQAIVDDSNVIHPKFHALLKNAISVADLTPVAFLPLTPSCSNARVNYSRVRAGDEDATSAPATSTTLWAVRFQNPPSPSFLGVFGAIASLATAFSSFQVPLQPQQGPGPPGSFSSAPVSRY